MVCLRDQFYDANDNETDQGQYLQNLRMNRSDFLIAVEGFDDVIDFSAEFNRLRQSHHHLFCSSYKG